MQPSTLVLLDGKDAVVAASGDDPYARYDIRDDVPVRGWAREGAVAWTAVDAFFPGSHALNSLGPVEPTAAVLTELLRSDVAGPTVLRFPRGVMPLLADDVRPPTWTDWDWWWSTTPPPAQAVERSVTWLGAEAYEEITALLDQASPTSSAGVHDEHVLRWCGIRSSTGDLIACAADVRYLPAVPHLASIATRPDQRGRGLGAAVTAWISRRCFEEDLGVVTFGMYAHNDTARRMYRRLGFTDSHHWSSARLGPR